MLPLKKLTVHYFSPANRCYKAKLEQNNQISTLSQEEALKFIASTNWTSTESKQVRDNKRSFIEKNLSALNLTVDLSPFITCKKFVALRLRIGYSYFPFGVTVIVKDDCHK